MTTLDKAITKLSDKAVQTPVRSAIRKAALAALKEEGGGQSRTARAPTAPPAFRERLDRSTAGLPRSACVPVLLRASVSPAPARLLLLGEDSEAFIVKARRC
jgi:hypothetical protein